MARIAGVQIERNTKGTATHIRINLKKWGNDLEDFLDKLEIKSREGEETIPWETAVGKLNKKHGVTK
jgi:hypothetical protein